MKNTKKLLETMGEAVVTAGAMLISAQQSARELQTYKDFLTSADTNSDVILRHYLLEKLPSIPYSSEETEIKDRKKGWKGWIVDPLDGSWNFFRQDDNWGISIGYIEKSQAKAGVVYLPGKNSIFLTDGEQVHARQFQTSLDMPLSIGLSRRDVLKGCSVWTDHNKKDPRLTTSIFQTLTKHTRYPQIRLCCTASMMALATGQIDGYVHPAPEPFDQAAAGLIIKTMGGEVTDLDGNPWHPFSESLVATNGLIHEELLKILKNHS